MATIKEIKEELVRDYAYSKADFTGENDKPLNFKQLEAILKKEKTKANVVEESGDTSLDEFDLEAIAEEKSKFKDDDLITVMAGINGRLLHNSQVGNGVFEFRRFGQKNKIPYKELKSMNNLARKTLTDGWFIILNKDLIKEFNLESAYTNFLTPARVDQILKMRTDDIREVIQKLPQEMRTTLFDEAKRRYDTGELDSSFIIKTFEDEYDISFEDNLPIK
jgi:hypothetical protein|nr:MAG TPA: hypothetical protein [Caudoviricetes sp.]